MGKIIKILCLGLSLLGFAVSGHAENLPINQIKLPAGFHISIYAQDLPGARQLALGEHGVVFVGTRGEGGKVYALMPNDNQTKAANVVTVASGLNDPNGVAVHDGDLYVGEINRIIRYANIAEKLANPGSPTVIANLPIKRWHGYRYIKFGPDGWLYVGIGMPCNTCDYRKTQPLFGTIIRMQPNGNKLEVYAKGIRNTVGFAWQPKTRALWFTDNGQDWMGDNLPPDEVNRAPKAGMDFGFPYFYGANIPAPDYQNEHISSKGITPPVWELPAHVAPLGATFYTGKLFPKAYQNQLFIAEHGSWNRSKKVGYQVVMLTVDGDKVTQATPFVTGWLQGKKEWGRPVDVLVMPDGALLISDDLAGVVYRVTYRHSR